MSAESQVIEWKVTGVREALRSFKDTSAAADGAAKSQKGLARAGDLARASAVRQTRTASRARQDAVRESKAQQRAIETENNALRRSAIQAEAQSRRLLTGVGRAADTRAKNAPKTPQTLAQRLMGVVSSSRFSVGEGGGRIMPLVGRTVNALAGEEGIAGLLGGEAAGGPVGWVLAAVTLVGAAALKGAEQIERLTEAAASASQEFQGLKFGTGSTTGEAARLSVMGGALGLSPSQMGGLAASLQENISGNGFGMATGLRAGVFNLPGQFGNPDTGGQLLKALQFLRSEAGPQQVRDARALGLSDALPGVANLSNSQFSRIGGDASLSAQVFNPRFAQQSADFMASLGRVQDAVQRLLAALAPAVIDRLTAWFNRAADAINAVATVAANNQAGLTDLVDFLEAVGEAAAGNYRSALAHIENITGGKNDKLAAALDRNTDATNANTQGVGQPGTYGHITRNTGLPAFGYGAAIRRNGDQRSFRLGIYG